MPNDILQVKYDDLDTVAARFTRQAEATAELQQRVRRCVETLEGGGWMGLGADAFFAEMEGIVLPALEHLVAALGVAQAATSEASTTIRRAEEEAARLFYSDGQRGSGVDGNVNYRSPISSPSSPGVIENADLSYRRFDRALEFMHNEMIKNARSGTVDQIRRLLEMDKSPIKPPLSAYSSIALALWASKVHSKGEWDHKPILENMLNLGGPSPDYYFPMRGDEEHEWYYDIWSNIHYGFVGSAAEFDEGTLQKGANLGEALTGRNDNADRLSVRIGIELWEKYGKDLTSEQLHQAILQHKDDYLQIQQEDPQVRVVVEPRNRQ